MIETPTPNPQPPTPAPPGIAFDAAAGLYDEHAAHNPMMIWLRRESLRRLAGNFVMDDRVIEIGCGTGEEAIYMARRGVHVVATDASAEMIAVVRRKLDGRWTADDGRWTMDDGRQTADGGRRAADGSMAHRPSSIIHHPSFASSGPIVHRPSSIVRRPPSAVHRPSSNITTSVLPVEQLGSLVAEYGVASFDGAYSSLGALNCTPNLEGVVESLAALVKPGGRLVISILNKYCLWEIAWYLAARRPGTAFRRLRGRAQGTALSGGAIMEVYYWPLTDIKKAFHPYFRTTRQSALPWALPPTYAAGFLELNPLIFAALRLLESGTSRLWPFYMLGDHVHLEMSRRC